MCIFISLLLFLMEKDWPILCKNLPRTKHFNVNPSKCGFTSPLTGLLVQIFAFHKHAQLTACYKSPAGWSKTPSPTSALLPFISYLPQVWFEKTTFWSFGAPEPCNAPTEGKARPPAPWPLCGSPCFEWSGDWADAPVEKLPHSLSEEPLKGHVCCQIPTATACAPK